MRSTSPIHIDVQLDHQDAQLLGVNSARAFVRDQPCRFEPHGDGDHLSSAWEGGEMTWCATAADALLLRSYERSSGYEAMVLWDLAIAGIEPHPATAWVVLSARTWPYD